MKRILVTAAGGAPAINFCNSLQDSNEDYFILGVDCDKYKIFRSKADVNVICPRATESEYIPYLNALIQEHNIDFLHAQPDIEVGVISDNRDKLNCKTFLPHPETVRILRDKFLSYEAWHSSGVPVPYTILLNNENDLKRAYDEIGESIWIREIQGAAGKGSMASPDYDTALTTLNHCNGWGRFTAATRLSPQTVTWMAIYKKGKLLVSQARERLYWEAGNRAQSGVTGITGTGRTVSDKSLDDLSVRAVFAIDKNPDGIFSVDMTLDQAGNPHLTEINIGKFFTTHYFFTACGINFPEIYIQAAFDEDTGYDNVMSPIEDDMLWIRGMDTEPRLIRKQESDDLVQDYKTRLKNL